jgi:hypothetical protein
MLGLDVAIFAAFVLGVGLATAGLEGWGVGLFIAGIVLAAIRGVLGAQPTRTNS